MSRIAMSRTASSHAATTSREFFEQKYRQSADPWSFASSEYEQRRYATIIGHIDLGRFDRVLEPGCSIGELTAQLADRCGHVTAIDIAASAVAVARARCAGLDNVEIEQASLHDGLPPGPFDLIVFSEIGYYFDEDAVRWLAGEMTRRLDIGGWLIAAHWTGESLDHVLAGPAVHEVLARQSGLEHIVHEEHVPANVSDDGFVLDIWKRSASNRSAALE
jgi:protein-L-isoaspartate O-methyltransferase